MTKVNHLSKRYAIRAAAENVRQRIAEHAGEASTGFGAATLAAIGRCLGTRSRRWLVAVILLLGMGAAAALAAAVQPADRTFTTLSGPVQMLMSVPLPLIGVLSARDLLRAPPAARVTPTLLGAALLAAAVGAFGVLACAATLAMSGTASGQWGHAGTIAVGSVLVQVVAQLVGTGLGLLLRPAIAFLATIVLPLGLWFLLDSVDGVHLAWLTPYAAAQDLLTGEMSALAWGRWFVVLLFWGAGLNAVGAARLSRRTQGRPASTDAGER